VTVTAYGYKPKRGVSVFYFTGTSPHAHKSMCRPKADTNSVITCSFAIPAGGPAGAHQIQIRGRDNKKPSHNLVYTLDFVRTP